MISVWRGAKFCSAVRRWCLERYTLSFRPDGAICREYCIQLHGSLGGTWLFNKKDASSRADVRDEAAFTVSEGKTLKIHGLLGLVDGLFDFILDLA